MMTTSETVVRVTPARVAAAPTCIQDKPFDLKSLRRGRGGKVAHHGVETWNDALRFSTHVEDGQIGIVMLEELHAETGDSAKASAYHQRWDKDTS